MWNVTIRDKGIKDEAITVQVEYKKGEESIVRNFAGNTQAEIDRRIGNYLQALETRDAEIENVTVGEWTAPVEEAPAEKTPEELEQDAWLEQWNLFVKAEKAMAALERNGITPTQEETDRFEALKKWVADNRKPEYSALITDSI